MEKNVNKPHKPSVSQHQELQAWVEEMARLCQPDQIVWIDGSEEEEDRLTAAAVRHLKSLIRNPPFVAAALTLPRPLH